MRGVFKSSFLVFFFRPIPEFATLSALSTTAECLSFYPDLLADHLLLEQRRASVQVTFC